MLAEHSHRLLAGFIGLLTLVLAVWIWIRDSRRWMRFSRNRFLGCSRRTRIIGGLQSPV